MKIIVLICTHATKYHGQNMNIDTALHTLELENRENITAESIQAAYLKLIKSKKDQDDFFEILKKLNVARDALNDEIASDLPAILKSNTDLTELMVQQAEIAKVRDAKEELKQSFKTTKAKLLSRPRRARDSAIFLTAAAGASTFFLSNMKDIASEFNLPPSFTLMFVMITGMLGMMAYMQNSKAIQLENHIDAFYEQITRVRNTEKLIEEVFSKSNTIPEEEFEIKLLNALQRMMNSPSKLGGFIFIGKGTIHIDDAVDFSDQYLDYLLNRGLIKVHKDADNNRLVTYVHN